MAVSFSEEDFLGLQNQLLELKTQNYGLREKNVKHENDSKHMHIYIEELKSEILKVQKTIQRSKNAREFDQLLQENKRLQEKLQSQEDEFRLQNQTLMQEIVTLTTTTDKLQKELEFAKSDNNSVADKEMVDGLLRLQAENMALKKMLHKVEGSANADIIDNANTGEADFDSRLRKETEVEENTLLKTKLEDAQKRHKEELLLLQNEVEKLAEKLKKKQESMIQLNEEKDKMYSEFQLSLKDAQTKSLSEIQQLKQYIQQLEQRGTRDSELSSGLNEQIFEEQDAKVEFMSGEKASFECSLSDSRQQLRDYEDKLHILTQQSEDSQLLVKKLEEEKTILLQQNQTLINEQEKLNAVIDEKTTLAEKRRNLMEEMNNHLLETNNKHSKEIDQLTKQLSDEQDAFQKIFEKEKNTRLELVQSQNEIKHLKIEMDCFKNERSSAYKDLTDTRQMLEETKKNHVDQLEQLESEHQKVKEELEQQLKTQFEDLNVQIEVVKAEKTEFEEKVVKFEQEIKDLHDEKKIVEKKNSSMVKDLRRQLVVERKRAEKLQERLQEVLNEQNRSVEEILQSSNTSDKPKGDASSVSSWSYVSAEAADRENPSHSDGSSCGRESPSCQSATALENETTNLLEKITHLQQKSWILEEKVNHLEMSNQALVDDVLKKTAIIQFYCMEGRSDTHLAAGQDKLTIKRIVDFIKDKGDENLREMNRKMQRMLEETLTKNMHLQKDIETLSNEVSRLSKVMDSRMDQNLQSAVFIDGI